MSVLINMEMPTLYRTYKVRFSESGDGKIIVGIANEDSTAYRPIGEVITVPPHGDLVERDALIELYADTDDLQLANMKVPIAVIRQNIMDMPTIIPADEPFGKSEQLNM